MKQYLYKARSKDGEIVKGKLEAENEQAAASLLLSKDLIPVDILDQVSAGFEIPFLNRVSLKDKTLIIRQLATMIGAGLPISQALTTLHEQAISKNVRNMLGQFMRDIESGSPLSQTLSGFPKTFSDTEINIVAAGEASGKLDEVLKRMADQGEKSYKNLKKIRGAFVYPVFLGVVAALIAGGISFYVMPQMESLYTSFDDAKLPIITRIMIGTSHFLVDYFVIIMVMIAALIAAVATYKKTPSGKYIWDNMKLHLPIFGKFIKMTYVASFTRTMESLVASGVPILDSLGIVERSMPNVIYKEAFRNILEKVKSGKTLSSALIEADIFAGMIPQMVRVGEQTGELDSMLGNLAEYFDEEIDNWVKNFQSLIEPVMMVIMGLVVAFIIFGIMLPIYQFGNIVGK